MVDASGMRFGLDLGAVGAHADPRDLAHLAREAEDAGWDGFFLWDTLVGARAAPAPVADPWIALAAIATATERIRLGPLVVPLPRHRPWLIARQAATLDRLSGGRVVLGVGLGNPATDEFGALGETLDLAVRARRADESLAIIAGLWSGQPFSHAGEFYDVTEVTFLPLPVQTPRIPIWVAATWPHQGPLRRAARWDGVVLGTLDEPCTPEIVRATVARITAQRRVSHPEGARCGAPFAVVVEFDALASLPRTVENVAGWVAAGVTWWVEAIFDPATTVATIRERIRQGPPRERGAAGGGEQGGDVWRRAPGG